MEYKIRVKTPGVSTMVQLYLFTNGYRWAGGDLTPRNLDTFGLVIDTEEKKIMFYGSEHHFETGDEKELNPWELAELLERRNRIKLNESYTAEITDNIVKVGCQEIEFDAVLELAEAIKNRKK